MRDHALLRQKYGEHKIDPFPYGTSNGVIVASLREKRWSSLSLCRIGKTWLDSNETDDRGAVKLSFHVA